MGVPPADARDPTAGDPVGVWIMHFVVFVLLFFFAGFPMRVHSLLCEGVRYLSLTRRMVRFFLRGDVLPR